MALNMLAAYYSRGCDSANLFRDCRIEAEETYRKHLNQYDVIYLNMQQFLIEAENRELTKYLEQEVLEEFQEEYGEFLKRQNSEALQKQYLDFLRNLLKDQPYVALAYMTGILPVKKYGEHSALNMFSEYSMIDQDVFEEYTGFTEIEVKELCERFNMDFMETSSFVMQ